MLFMAEGARDIRREAAENAKEIMRKHEPELEGKDLARPEIDEAYLGDVASRLFDLQAERARLEGEGASAADLLKIDAEIAPLQAFVDEHAEDYARMEMPRETTKTVRVPEKLREKQPELKTQLKDLQKRYDLTAAQLENETDPDARMALENGLDSLRERIHGAQADLPWEKEDRLLAKGTIKRPTAARLEYKKAAEESWESAELDRATLSTLRNEYAAALGSGTLAKAGETLIRGALQTIDDALTRYGRGSMSTGEFQERVAEINKARKMWDRYVADAPKEEVHRQKKEKERADVKEADAAAAEFRATLEARRQARQEIDAMIAAGIAESEERRKTGEKQQSAEEFRAWMDQQKAKLGKGPKETEAAMAEIHGMISELRSRPSAEDMAKKVAMFEEHARNDDRNLEMAEGDIEALSKGQGESDIAEKYYPGWTRKDFAELFGKMRGIRNRIRTGQGRPTVEQEEADRKRRTDEYYAREQQEIAEMKTAIGQPITVDTRVGMRTGILSRVRGNSVTIEFPDDPDIMSMEMGRREAAVLLKEEQARTTVPDNLPVAPETSLEEQQRARAQEYVGKQAHVIRSDGRAQDGLVLRVDSGRVLVQINDERRREQSLTKNPTIAEFLRWQDMAPQDRLRSDATARANELVDASVARVNAKIDALQQKVRAEQKRLAGDVSESPAEARFFAQGDNPDELARREQAQERYPAMTPDDAVAEMANIEAKSARDFENETEFAAAFAHAVAKDPLHRVAPEAAAEYARQYWELLTKDNERLAEAMKPQPKVGFWKRLFGGAPRPKETMTAQEIVQFQKMDKLVREILEAPATGARADLFRSGMGKSTLGGPMGIGRGRPS